MMSAGGSTVTCLPVQLTDDALPVEPNSGGPGNGKSPVVDVDAGYHSMLQQWQSCIFFRLGGVESRDDIDVLNSSAGPFTVGIETDIIEHENASVVVLRLQVFTNPADPLVGEVLMTPGGAETHYEILGLLGEQQSLTWFFSDQQYNQIYQQSQSLSQEWRDEFLALRSEAMQVRVPTSLQTFGSCSVRSGQVLGGAFSEVSTAMLATIFTIIVAGVPLQGIAGSVAAVDTQSRQTDEPITANGSGSTVEVLASDKPVSDEVRWKRAIDRDDTDMLRQLLSKVDVKLTNDKGKTALMASDKTGPLDLLETLLQRGLALDDRSFTGGTSLMYAALGRQYTMISYLLDARRDTATFQSFVDAESTNGWTAVMIAAAKGFDGVVQQLVEDGGADAWRADAYQWTPLMRAIDNRHTEVIDYLLSLDRRALDSINENGATALHVAAEKRDARSVRLLLERKIDPDIRDNAGRSALDIAIDRGDKSIMQLLGR